MIAVAHSVGGGGTGISLKQGRYQTVSWLVLALNAVPHVMSFGFGPHHPLNCLLNRLNTLGTLYYTGLG